MMTGRPREILVSVAALALLLSWVIYPPLMATLAFLGPGSPQATKPAPLAASIAVATRDDVEAIARRMGNIEVYRRRLDRLDLIVALDCAGRLHTKAHRNLIVKRARIIEGVATANALRAIETFGTIPSPTRDNPEMANRHRITGRPLLFNTILSIQVDTLRQKAH